jgi:hypothetical protein
MKNAHSEQRRRSLFNVRIPPPKQSPHAGSTLKQTSNARAKTTPDGTGAIYHIGISLVTCIAE